VNNKQNRTKTCNSPSPSCGGSSCSGSAYEERHCIISGTGCASCPNESYRTTDSITITNTDYCIVNASQSGRFFVAGGWQPWGATGNDVTCNISGNTMNGPYSSNFPWEIR
jgi:hypothetical protein